MHEKCYKNCAHKSEVFQKYGKNCARKINVFKKYEKNCARNLATTSPTITLFSITLQSQPLMLNHVFGKMQICELFLSIFLGGPIGSPCCYPSLVAAIGAAV